MTLAGIGNGAVALLTLAAAIKTLYSYISHGRAFNYNLD